MLLYLAILVGLVGPLFATTWHLLGLQRESLERLFEFETGRKVELLADGLEAPVWNLIPAAGRPLVRSAMDDPVFLSVLVTTPGGIFLEARNDDDSRIERRVLRRSIVHEGQAIGEVTVEVDTSGIGARIARHSRDAYAVGGFQLVVSLAVVALVVSAARRAERVEVLREHNERLAGQVDERKRAQEDLAVRERHLQLIADTLPVLVSHIDRDLRYVYVNRPRAEMLQESADEIIGRTVSDVRGVERLAVIKPHLDAVLAGRRVEFESEVADTAKGRCIFRSVFVPEIVASGEVVGAFLFAEDVTEQRAVEGQLRRSQKMEAVGQLTGGIAHDFNNLLQVITLNLEILEAELDRRNDLHEMVRTAQESARRGAALTRQLLVFSRQQMLDPRIVDVTEFVVRTERMLRRTLGETIDIRTEMDEATWPVEIDPTFLESALVNLAVNARDAMPDGGRLIVRTGNLRIAPDDDFEDPDLDPGPYVLLEVADTGSGMAPHVVERAFDPFFTTKEVGQGTGLGLSMVYGFVKQSSGHIRIYSEPGHGTSVKMYLPRATGTPEPAVETAPPTTLPGGTEHVLVVEDDPDVRRASVMQLERLGYTVSTAQDGPSALAFLDRDRSVDLLFSDVVLPSGLTGVQLAAHARTLMPALRVLFCSGYPRSAINDGESLDIIAKPYRRQELAQRVRAAIDGTG